MTNHIRVYTVNGSDLLTMQGDYSDRNLSNVGQQAVNNFIADCGCIGASAFHQGETLILSIPEQETSRITNKLRQIFPSFKIQYNG